MANRQKISQMTPKGANLAATDLLEISEDSGTGYITKSITGQEIIDAAAGGSFVPYTGATADVDLGAFSIEATTIVKTGGLSTEFLMADGTTSLGGGGGGLTIGTTAIASGTDGRVLFQAGGVLQQDATFFWDNTNKRLGVGATPASNVRLDVRAQGALSTDIAFRVRNSVDTGNLAFLNGTGDVSLGISTITAGSGGNGQAVAIGAGAATNTGFNTNPIAIGKNSAANGNSIAIGNGANAGTGQAATSSLVIGLNSTCFSGTNNNVVIGNSNASTSSSGENILIGDNINFGGNGKNTFGISIGRFFNATAFTSSGAYAIGSGVSAASPALLNITDSFSVYFRNTQRSFFVNKNTNIVMKSLSALTAGTHFEAAATNTFTIHNGTAPVANIADAYAQFSADITAGNAAPHFRTENGNVIKIYRETTAVVAAAFVANTSAIVDDTATFGGYTMGQVVAALKAQGLLA